MDSSTRQLRMGDSARVKALAAPALHLGLLIALSLFAFNLHPARCFLGNDGPTAIAQAQEQLAYFGVSFNLHTDFLKGIGNFSFPNNYSLMPPFWFSLYNAQGLTPAAAYACFALFTFAATLLIGWNWGASRGVRYAAAWLLAIIFVHYTYRFQIYAIAGGMPHITLVLLTTALFTVALWRAGKGGWAATIGYGALLLFALFIGLLTNPLFLIAMVPFLLFVAFFSLFTARDRAEITRKIAACLGVLLLAFLLGWSDYFLGLVRDTAFFVFPREVLKPEANLLYNVSILYQGGGFDSQMGPWLFLAATLGASLALWAKERSLRLAAILLLCFQFLIAGVGGIVLETGWMQAWNGPILLYFEIPAFPVYALFAAYGVLYLLTALTAKSTRAQAFTSSAFATEISTAIAVALLAVYITASAYETDRSRAETSSMEVPPASTPFTQTLAETIGLTPGATFAGRVLSIIPNKNFRTQYPFFVLLNALMGNDQQTTGLWLKGIPTLHEYNQLITPGFFWLTQHFLSAPGVAQIRNWTNFSAINVPILRLLGVRYIISIVPEVPGATVISTIAFGPRIPVQLRLFELSGVNVAGISAKKVVTVDSLDTVESVMKSPAFDLSTAVMVDAEKKPFTDTLVAANAGTIVIEKGGYHLRADSAGKTLLILPVEFSRCMDFIPVSGAAPKAMRVDGGLLGLLFEKMVDVKFVMETGLFTHQDCRLRDYREFEAMLGATH